MLWGIHPVEQTSAFGLAAHGLRRQIHLGLVVPGERLPTERQLAQEIAIARMTLRQALQILEEEGYITVRRGANGGIFVMDEMRLGELAQRHLSRDPGSVMRLMEFRDANEALAATLAARRRTPAQLAQMRQAVDALAAATSAGELRRAESLFLMAMVEATGNEPLISAIEGAAAAMFVPITHTAQAVEASSAVHQQLLSAIKRRDSEAAELGARAALAILYERLRRVVPALTRAV